MEKDKFCMIPFMYHIEQANSETENRDITRGSGVGWELLFNGYRASVWDDEVLKLQWWWL